MKDRKLNDMPDRMSEYMSDRLSVGDHSKTVIFRSKCVGRYDYNYNYMEVS